MKKNISISTCFNYDIPIEEQLDIIAKSGFKYISLGSNTNHSGLFEDVKKLKSLLKKYDLSIDTIHGCRTDIDDSVRMLKKFACAAKELEVSAIVVHPCQFYIEDNMVDEKLFKLLNVCDDLKPIAKEYNVKFAIENLHPKASTEVVKRALNKLDREVFGLCYDSSHDQVDGPRDFNLLEEFGDRVIAVHLSDRIKEFVDHVVPGEGFIDFEIICNLLKRKGYSNSILMEVSKEHTIFKDDIKFLEETYRMGCIIFDKVNARSSWRR
ncbi:sugar phosphate isomerase/epimerase family protein [Clostridium omnivorum]|uniref:Xylose isomerase-like TIM barrel domain-containing protein n=1 Tax=Clostridium omnivorum TaxID=1604902 RepID=A0ABQ5N5Z2_9CLOT|nr:sugar phosphate isomerase/epimerase family protein [Clostridium sp. E14]GLC30619.1 hypothetical protein bsdE14_20290 [Clostridium sp. E14]